MNWKRTTLLATALLLAALAPFTTRPVAQADRVDEFITKELQSQRIPGLSLAVVKDGTIVKSQGYGVANRESSVPATPQTVYKIGSVSKQFIATGIMLLAQDGRLTVDDPISRFLDGTPPAWKAITVRHLLTHTSGIVREAPAFDWSKRQPDADVIKSAYPLPLRFDPGTKWEYSNTGYFALAEIISKVSGVPWNEYLAQKVFRPAGMTSTHATHANVTLANRAAGYSDNDELRPAGDWPASRPSGAFFSTAADLAKWDAGLNTNSVLREATRRQMWTPVSLTGGGTHPYGFGWELNPLEAWKRVHHGGGLPGFQSEFARYPDNRLTVIVLINLDDADVEGIADGVAALYLGVQP
jgi:CubicO group peptidase (beta-lactamase class C family)